MGESVEMRVVECFLGEKSGFEILRVSENFN